VVRHSQPGTSTEQIFEEKQFGNLGSADLKLRRWSKRK